MALLQPEAPLGTRLFISGILTATSVGITARVLRDLQQTYRTEAKIILGAAAIDDVLGLLVLAVASALVATGTIGWLRVAGVVTKSAGVLFGLRCPGAWGTPPGGEAVPRARDRKTERPFWVGVALFLFLSGKTFGAGPGVCGF